MNPPLGHHALFDFHDCSPAALTDTARLRQALLAAVREAGGTIVTDTFHTFSPHGVSGVIVIAESHVTIHTWPEHGYAAVDAFSCGVALDQDCIRDRLREALSAREVEEKRFARGGLVRTPAVPLYH